MLNYYLSSTCNTASQNGIFKIETLSTNLNNKTTPHQTQTDDKDFIFSRVFEEYILKTNSKLYNEQIENSQTMFSQLSRAIDLC